MKKSIIFGGLVVIVLCAVALLVISFTQDRTNQLLAQLPDGAKTVTESYLEAAEISYSEVIPFVYFPSEDMKRFYVDAESKLDDWRLKSVDEINPSLYALTLEIKSKDEHNDNMWHQIWNFVGYVNGEWKYMIGTGYIPEELSDGLDVSRYDYGDGSFAMAPNVTVG